MKTRSRGATLPPSHWSDKNDKWLVEVLHGDDTQHVDTAMQVLQGRYRSRLVAFLRAKLPNHWIDDALHEIWISFYQQARTQEIRNVAAYLRGIAINIRAREVEKLTRERECEQDIDPTTDNDLTQRWASSNSIEELLEEEEARVIEDHQLDLLKQLPFIDSQLSDCQRIYWVLRAIHQYPSKAVGRLLGRSANNIDVQTNKARATVKRYFQSDNFRFALLNEELPVVWEPRPRREGAVVVERFAESISPQFTPDELKPLGLSLAELQTHYMASLILPRWHVGQELNMGGISMLLTRRPDWADWQELCDRLAQGEEEVGEFVHEACFLNVEIEDSYVHLAIQPLVELVPENPKSLFSSDNTYLSIHASRLVIPVILGFFDRSLYTPELLERWPFVPPETGL